MTPEMQEELIRIYQRDGKLTPGMVLEEAAKPSSVLHSAFVWDDSAAAHQYRLIQAGQLIRRVRVVHQEAPDAPARRVTLFHDVSVGREEREYQSVDVIARDVEMRERAEARARAEMTQTRRRYEALVELLPLAEEVFATDIDVSAGGSGD